MAKKFKDSALILVDIQNDFCPGGALGVRGGDEIISVVNQLVTAFPLVIASKDWHPANHISFKAQGGPWDPHCVQHTHGAAFHPDLDQSKIHLIFHKAISQDRDAYSAFEGVDQNGRSLDAALKALGVKIIYIAGLATDYCVKATALDGLKNGYEVVVIKDAIRGVEVNEGDSEKAIHEIAVQGAKILNSPAVLPFSKTAQIAGD